MVRRVQRLNKATIAAADNGGYTQDQLFTLWRHHGFVTNSTLTTVAADWGYPRLRGRPTATTPSSNRSSPS